MDDLAIFIGDPVNDSFLPIELAVLAPIVKLAGPLLAGKNGFPQPAIFLYWRFTGFYYAWIFSNDFMGLVTGNFLELDAGGAGPAWP